VLFLSRTSHRRLMHNCNHSTLEKKAGSPAFFVH
jgi:hypothetical protein